MTVWAPLDEPMARQDFSVEISAHSRTNAQSNLFSAQIWKIYKYIIDLVNKIFLKIDIYATDNENKSNISIDVLNEDCLRHIFSYLPLKDMLTVGSVSRTWNEISETMLPKITGLTYNTVQERLSFSDLKKILNRCGKQFRYVDFNICDDYRLSRSIEMVGEKCNNLQFVNITRYILSDKEILNFYPFVELSSITIGNNSEQTLVILLIFLKNLRRLKILNCYLWGPDIFYRSLTADAIPDMHKLRYLSISECTGMKRDSLFILNSPTITSLRLHNNNPPIRINNMPNLCSLNLSCCQNLNDVLFHEICEKCKNLTKLNISYCTGISDAALSSLIRLRNLKHLKMNGLLNITDPKVNNLRNLKILECKGCTNLHNTGLFALINTSLSLEVLDVSDCRCITHDLINRIICLWKKAICFNILTIYISGTNVDKNSLIEFMPFVRLCETPYVGKSIKDNIPIR